MDKKKIKRIVKNCNKGIDQAENEVKKLSSKEIIELKHNGCPVRQICEKYRFSKNTTLYYFECSLQNTRQEK